LDNGQRAAGNGLMDYVINREKMNFADASSHERELNSGRDSDQDPRDSISG